MKARTLRYVSEILEQRTQRPPQIDKRMFESISSEEERDFSPEEETKGRKERKKLHKKLWWKLSRV